MLADFPIPQPGQSLSISFAKANVVQRQAVASLMIMAYATQYPLFPTRKAVSEDYYLTVPPTSLPAVLSGKLGVSLEQVHNLFKQGPPVVFAHLRSLPVTGRKLAMTLALFLITPHSPDLVTPLMTKLVMGWGLETQLHPNDVLPYMLQYGEQIHRFLTGKEFTSN